MTNTQPTQLQSNRYRQLLQSLSTLALICLTVFLTWQLAYQPAKKITTEFWIWQEIDMQYANQADGVVLLQGEFRHRDDHLVFENKGLTPHPIKHVGGVSILIRAHELPSASVFIERVDHLLMDWKKAGATISGIQIEYNSPDDKLEEYLAFLTQLSAYYGKNFLSITARAVWLDEHFTQVNTLADVVDYVAIQFYQVHQPIPNAQNYLDKLGLLTVKYKLGVTTAVEFDQFQPKDSSNYLGKLVFLNGKAPL